MKSQMFEGLHREIHKAINEAREANLGFTVVTLQNAISCLDLLQKDSEDLENIRKLLGLKDDKAYLRPISRNK